MREWSKTGKRSGGSGREGPEDAGFFFFFWCGFDGRTEVKHIILEHAGSGGCERRGGGRGGWEVE